MAVCHATPAVQSFAALPPHCVVATFLNGSSEMGEGAVCSAAPWQGSEERLLGGIAGLQLHRCRNINFEIVKT